MTLGKASRAPCRDVLTVVAEEVVAAWGCGTYEKEGALDTLLAWERRRCPRSEAAWFVVIDDPSASAIFECGQGDLAYSGCGLVVFVATELDHAVVTDVYAVVGIPRALDA